MTMICDNCGRAGVRWMGPLSNLTHTECPHCGGQNCQRPDNAAEEYQDQEDFEAWLHDRQNI